MKESCRFFKGCFKFAGGKKLSDDQYLYLLLFWRLKRYKRDGRILRGCADPIRERVGLPVGPEGVFFVSSKEFLDLPIETQTEFRQTRDIDSRWMSEAGLYDGVTFAKPFRDKSTCEWVPSTDGSEMERYTYDAGSYDDLFYIRWIAENILKRWDLKLEKEVWYQGQAQNEIGRLIADEKGFVEEQDIRKTGAVNNMLGAAIRNDVRLAEALPREQLAMKDPFGRTPLLLAAWFESYDMLDWLGAQSKRATWQLDACYSKQPCPFNSHFDGANLLHLLPTLDATHPAVPRLLSRLLRIRLIETTLNDFVQLPALVEHLPDPTTREWRHNPLTLSVFLENALVTEWLLIKGAARDPFDICGGIYSPRGISQGLCGGSYPLVRAAMQKDGTILKVLLRHGARADSSRKANYPEVHWRTIGRVTSLHVAAYHRCFENVRVLVVNGADFERLANFAEDSCVYSERFLTPREAVKEGLKYRKVHEESEDGDETEGRTLEEKAVVVAALAEFDLAVRRALEERRLLVLGCLRARARRLPSVPSHLLKCIFESAKLSYSAR